MTLSLPAATTADILYLVDGDDEVEEEERIYSQPIDVRGNATLRAWVDGGPVSPCSPTSGLRAHDPMWSSLDNCANVYLELLRLPSDREVCFLPCSHTCYVCFNCSGELCNVSTVHR